MHSIFLTALFAGVALASPKLKPSAFCTIVDKLVTAAHQQTQATSFCSSYLHITQSTVTSTITTIATVTTPACANPAAAKRTPAPEITPAAVADIEARDPGRNGPRKAPATKPSCFQTYTVSSILSSACSCLSITPGTVTTTTTYTSDTITTPLTFFLSGPGGYATLAADSNYPGEYHAVYTAARADAVSFSDPGPGYPDIFYLNYPVEYHPLPQLPKWHPTAPTQGLMYERVQEPGRLFFNVQGATDEDIENVLCSVDGAPGQCHLTCMTGSNSGPTAPGPFDGYNVEQLCNIDPGFTNEWWLNNNLGETCQAFVPMVIPID